MAQTIELRIPSDPRMLKIVRGTVAHLCQVMNLSNIERNSVVLAVDEACSNIIKHAYAGQPDKPIEITFNLTEERLEILFLDFGKPADKNKIKSRNLDDIRPGGLGVHLINNVMDEVNYESTSSTGNRLSLIKYFPKHGQPG